MNINLHNLKLYEESHIAPLDREGLVERGTTSLSLTPIGRFACDRVVDIFDRRSRRLEQVRPERGGL